jgi:hypothetical protein
MAKKQDLGKLRSIMDDHSRIEGAMLYKNSFALACYLFQTGEERAAFKMLKCLLDTLGCNSSTVYFGTITDTIKEHHKEYAREIFANIEITKLLD